VGIALFQAAFDAVTFGFPFVILDAVFFIGHQVTVGIGYRVTAPVTLYFA
jgi:hypothetical protein